MIKSTRRAIIPSIPLNSSHPEQTRSANFLLSLISLASKIDYPLTSTHYLTRFISPTSVLQGFSNLLSRISRLTELKPSAISITWGAGGSTRDRTLELASVTQRDYGVDTIMHVTCTNMEQGMVDDALRVRFVPLLTCSLSY